MKLVAALTDINLDGMKLPIVMPEGPHNGILCTKDTPYEDEAEEYGVSAYLFANKETAKAALRAWQQMDWDNAWAVAVLSSEGPVIINIIQYGTSWMVPVRVTDMRGKEATPMEHDSLGVDMKQPREYLRVTRKISV